MSLLQCRRIWSFVFTYVSVFFSSYNCNCCLSFMTFMILLIVQMPSQKQVHCWSSSDKLSSEVIFDPSTDCYYGVFNHTRIGKWSRSSLTMKDMKKFNVSFSISTDYVLVMKKVYLEYLFLSNNILYDEKLFIQTTIMFKRPFWLLGSRDGLLPHH